MTAFLLGFGQTPFTGGTDLTLTELGSIASRAALQDAGVEIGEIDVCVAGSAFEHPGVGQKVLLGLGLNGIPLINIEGACASGGSGVIEAMRWIEAGAAEIVLVVGIEKMASRFKSGPLELVGQTDPFGAAGATLPSIFGMLAEHHMHAHGSTPEDFARITHKNRSYARHNRFARFTNPPSLEEILAQPMIATPLRKLDCCANADGAAALVVASEATARARGLSRAVPIRAGELGGGVLGDRLDSDPMTPLADRAYAAAGVGPEDIDVIECHDNFSIGEFECYERLRFCPDGQGQDYLRAGKPFLEGDGALFNPSGGLLGRGHPAGATCAAQFGSVMQQLRGEAGPMQRPGARLGMIQTSGGGVLELQSNTSTVFIVGG
jgi:acetyl-CoA acetyltransferase